MKTPKKFDCIEMKTKLQAQLLEEFGGLTDEEFSKQLQKKLNADPGPVGRMWRAKPVSPPVHTLIDEDVQ